MTRKTDTTSSPMMVESAAMRAAEIAVASEREQALQQVFAKGTRILGIVTAFAMSAFGAAAFWFDRAQPPEAIVKAAVPDELVASLEFVATANDGRTAGFTYESPARVGRVLLRARAGDRHVDEVAPAAPGAAAAAGLNGPPPTPLPFTQDGSAIDVVIDGQHRKLTFQTWDEPCTAREGETTRQWRLCEVTDDEPACAVAPELVSYCFKAEPRLVSLHRSGDVLWVIAERPMAVTPRMAAGVLMPQLFRAVGLRLHEHVTPADEP